MLKRMYFFRFVGILSPDRIESYKVNNRICGCRYRMHAMELVKGIEAREDISVRSWCLKSVDREK